MKTDDNVWAWLSASVMLGLGMGVYNNLADTMELVQWWSHKLGEWL